MSHYQDLETMIEIIHLAIARQETEEQFFRRSAQASSNEVAHALFTEIADDMKKYIDNLEQRKQRLLDALEALTTAEKE
jgi:rubrerythrin